MEQSLYDRSKSGSWMQQTRKWMAPIVFCAGFGIILFLLVSPGESGIPGWQPVNGALHATLSGDGEQAASPVSAAMPSNSASNNEGQQAALQSAPDSTASRAALLDLNTATIAQLQDLPGIGPSKAQAIVAYRESRSGFKAVDDLLQVKGIGPKIFEKIAPLVAIGEGKK